MEKVANCFLELLDSWGSGLCFDHCVCCCYLRTDVKIQTSLVNLLLDSDWINSPCFVFLIPLPVKQPFLPHPPVTPLYSLPDFNDISSFFFLWSLTAAPFLCLPLSLTSSCSPFPPRSSQLPSPLLLFLSRRLHLPLSLIEPRRFQPQPLLLLLFVSLLPFVFSHLCVWVCVWHSGESPSLDTASVSLRTQVYH